MSNNKLTFKVTAEDIRSGTKQDPCECAIARALRRVYPNEFIIVEPGRIQIGAASYKINADVDEWIRRFDTGSRVNPRTITLERKSDF